MRNLESILDEHARQGNVPQSRGELSAVVALSRGLPIGGGQHGPSVNDTALLRLSEKVGKASEEEELRAHVLEEEVLDLAKVTLAGKEEREDISHARAAAIRTLDEQLHGVMAVERGALKEAEAVASSSILAMQGAIARGLLEEARQREEGARSLQMSSSEQLAGLRESVHEGILSLRNRETGVFSAAVAERHELRNDLERCAARRAATHASLRESIATTFGKLEAMLEEEKRMRRVTEETLSAFLERTIASMAAE